MSGHTPLPWERELGGKRGAWIQGTDGNWSALSCGQTDAEASANAEFIVRACNSHYELLEALIALRDYGCPVCAGDCASANPPVTACPMQMAAAAIAKARNGGAS